jgi:hypothetical protein
MLKNTTAQKKSTLCNQLYESGRILLGSHKAVTFMKAGKGVWGLVCSPDNELQGAKLLRTVQCPKSPTPLFTARCSLCCDSLPRPACTRHRTLAMFTVALKDSFKLSVRVAREQPLAPSKEGGVLLFCRVTFKCRVNRTAARTDGPV